MTKELISRRNEADANKTVAKVMVITLGMLTLAYLLNVTGIFIIPHKLMATAYFGAIGVLLCPLIIHRIIGSNHFILKYLYVVCSAIFIFAITMTLTYHVVLVYVFPIAIAEIYFNKRLTVAAIILTLTLTAVGQILAFWLKSWPDANFPTWPETILFCVVPRFLMLFCMSVLLHLLAKRTTRLLSDQINDSNQILEFHQDMVFGFATLVENRDESTGGHVKRTSRYVELLASEMANNRHYKEMMDKDFIQNLTMAAPMHDIGKIAVPDSILQKPGKLTPEEYEIMKTHTVKGGQIIRQTFGHVGNEMYRQMAYNVARFHHEKWNGMGYPDGLKGDDIPLSARIMAVADVFDAVSQKRCYRDALPLEECFDIIEQGRGTDFDPAIVDVFMEIRDKV
ncbi:MAG: HD domain-containing protein, partial [Spirochaetales bacterium]|nr:HD domain-containing protein [Spirochaetales bacterium]